MRMRSRAIWSVHVVPVARLKARQNTGRSKPTSRAIHEAHADRDLMPGVVAIIQTFGNRLNFHPHPHMLVTEGGRTSDGSFHPVPIFNDAALARIFAHEVLAFLVSRELISPETAGKILSRRHTGFNVHSKVRATALEDARRVARYMAKPILALKRLSFDLAQGRVIYRYGKSDADKVEMDDLDFIARVTAGSLPKNCSSQK